MKISLHLGAHKTASTFIQNGFERNLDTLRANGVDFIPTDVLRPNFTRALNGMAKSTPAEAAKLRTGALDYLDRSLSASTAPRMILSDENLLGVPAQLVETGRMYDPHPDKMAALAEGLAGHEVEIFIGTRQMAQFGRSVFCEALRGIMTTYVPVEDFKANWRASQPSWGGLINKLRNWFPTQRITLWNMADFKEDPQGVMNVIAGLEAAAAVTFDLKGAQVRPSLSHNAIAALLEIGAREGPLAMAAKMEETRVANRRGPDNWNYRMWDKAEEQEMVSAYTREMRVLAMNSGTSSAPVTVFKPS